MSLENVLLILVVILMVFLILCILVFLRVWRVTKDAIIMLQILNQSLPLILKNIEEITGNVNSSSGVINSKIQDYIYGIPDNLSRKIFAVAKGMQVFAKFILKKEKV